MLTVEITFGRGKDRVVMQIEALSVLGALELLATSGWEMDKVTKTEVIGYERLDNSLAA